MLEKAGKVFDQMSLIRLEIKGFQYAVKVLSEEMDFHKGKILDEIERIRDTYNIEISKIKPSVDDKVKKLTAERERKKDKAVETAEKKLRTLIERKDRCEDELRKLERDQSIYQEKVESYKQRRDKATQPAGTAKPRASRVGSPRQAVESRASHN